MPIEKFDQWTGARVKQNFPLSTLKDAVIGIDATYYLELNLKNNEEFLIHAHGGLSLTLERELEDDLKTLQAAGATVIFVFNGLNHVNKSPSDSQSTETARAIENGFIKHRNKDDQAKITDEFSKAKYPVNILYRYLQDLLIKYKVDFLVAPYGAAAQLSYLLKSPEQYIDTVMGTTECFVFGMDKVITRFNHGKDVTTPTFDFISRSACEERLKATPDLLRDAQLLLGTSFSLTFPPLQTQAATKLVTIQDSINMLNTAQRSVLNLCKMYSNDPAVVDLDYSDRYKKLIMTVRHHIVIETNGSVAPLDFQQAPGDVHEFVGQRLPEELFFYISRGLIGADVPNWLTQGEVVLPLPSGVRDSEPYRRLVVEQLNPIRAVMLKVLAEQLHYYYQTRKIDIRTWDGRNTGDLAIALKEEPALKEKMSSWQVKGPDIANIFEKSSEPLLLSCLRAVKDKAFVKKTVVSKHNGNYPALCSKSEIIANTLWRFLHLRGYINDSHELTKWGQALETTLENLDAKGDPEGQAILAIELLRAGLLNGNEVDGTVVPTSDKEYRFRVSVNLISKITCLGKYQNKYGVGYCGALDRQLLAFAWMITALRSTLRNLMESVMVAMFLSGEAERERKDWKELITSLPLMEDHGALLGIMTKTYLVALKEDSKAAGELKEKIKNLEKPHSYFGDLKHGNLNTSIKNAWKIWDAISEGAQKAGKDFKEQKLFADANDWLAPRR